MTSLTFANPLPWWGVAAALAACAVVAWFAYARFAVGRSRRNVLMALRFVTLALIVIVLMRPVRTTDQRTRDIVVPVLVDVSRSMKIADAGDGERRIDRARDLVTRELLPALTQQFQVELLSFGERVAATTPEKLDATAGRSDLGGAIVAARDRYRGRPVAGIVVLSDGGDTSGTAIPGDTPVYPVGVGSPVIARDREVLSVTAAEAVLDDSRIDLAVSAVSHGHGLDAVPLQLLENGKPVEVQRVTPGADGTPIRAVFHVSPARGAATVYTVEVPAAAGELVSENNTRSVIVQPPARARHVLFVQGAPGFEHGFLKRAWALDPGLDVDAVVRKGKNEQGADTFYIQASQAHSDMLIAGYPQRAEDLFKYDVVVLANADATQFTPEQFELTRDFVGRRGGGLLVLGGRSFGKPGLGGTALEEALPLKLSERGDAVLPASPRGMNRVALTPAGESHPIMQLGPAMDETRKRWDSVPALAATAPLGGPRPGANVLAVTGGAAGGSRALIAVQRYGEGRTMVFTGEASWRWRMMLPSTDRSFDTFWRQAVRWLALPATDPVAIDTPAGVSPGGAWPLRAQVRNAAFEQQADATLDIHVTSPDGRTEDVRAALDRSAKEDASYVADVRVDRPGVYHVKADARRGATPLGSAEAEILVGGADIEMTDPRLNLQALQRVALSSGGRVVTPGDFGSLVGALRSRVPAARLAVTSDVWNNAAALAVLLFLPGAEWILRRRWGLR